MDADAPAPRLLATSDLHVHHSYPENRAILEGMVPGHAGDWLLVAGDVAETVDDVRWALGLLSERFHTVIWAPGNHELWTIPSDPVSLRGVRRYEHLVDLCRGLGVLTPEDPFATWEGTDGPVTVAPLFLLYDYSFLPPDATDSEQAYAQAQERGIVLRDEVLLHPDPFPSRTAWCHDRVARTQRRLDDLGAERMVLVNHYPLHPHPTRVLHYPEIGLWSGTQKTADWHLRYDIAAVVYGHLHIPRTTWQDGVRFEEVSIGYPRERSRRGLPRGPLRQILPEPSTTAAS